MIKYVFAPALLPTGTNIYVSVADENKDTLFSVFNELHPNSCVKHLDRFDKSTQPNQNDLILLTEGDWKTQHDQIVERYGTNIQLALMPIPVGDPWGWWEWAKRAEKIKGGISYAYKNKLSLPPNKESKPLGEDRHFLCFHMHKLSGFVKQRINLVLSKLANDTDREILFKVLTGTPEELSELYFSRLFKTVQYAEYISLKPDAVVVNGGVHLGSEIPLFLTMQPQLGKLYNVDPIGYAQLSSYALKWVQNNPQETSESAIAFSDKAGFKKMLFCDDGQLATSLNEITDVTEKYKFVPCLSVDAFVKSRMCERVDLIKFDLEGDEIIVIPSMIDLINKYRPQLAISIYHKINHFWDIPEFLMASLKGYRFHVRHYSSQAYETVLYCIPT